MAVSPFDHREQKGHGRMTPPPLPASKETIVVDETGESRKRARLAILELANMISVPMALNAIVQLNVADAIWSSGSNTPLSASQIVARILPNSPSADANNLQRLLRLLTSFGVFNEHLSSSSSYSSSVSATTVVERRYSLTEIGKTLVTDEDGLSYGAYVLQHHHEALVKAWPLVSTAVEDPTIDPFVRANGEKAYTYYGKIEGMNELMQRAMAGVSVPFMRAVLGCGYDGFGSGGGGGVKVERLVDVGGSGGDCLRMIMQKYENIKEGINFDLPEVVAKAPPIPGVTHFGGDMFTSIPSGDAIFMKWILTTWTDDEVKLIMKNCHKALPVGGKLIACEPALPEHSDDSHQTRALLEGDIFVMTIYGAKGKHRTEEEYKQLGFSAGFPHFRAVHIDYFYTVLEFRK